jgi:hypothetical protein
MLYRRRRCLRGRSLVLRAFDTVAIGSTLLITVNPAANLEYDVIVQRTGMRLLLAHSQFGQQIENHVGLYFQLAGQLVDADLAHKRRSGACVLVRRSLRNSTFLRDAGIIADHTAFPIVTNSFSRAFPR